jgi:putative addiction module component (TIGR02574 family)
MLLPPEDRAYVVDALEQTLSSEDFATPELAAAWGAEIERRVGAYERGELPAEEMEVALAHIRQQLADFRSRKGNS